MLHNENKPKISTTTKSKQTFTANDIEKSFFLNVQCGDTITLESTVGRVENVRHFLKIITTQKCLPATCKCTFMTNNTVSLIILSISCVRDIMLIILTHKFRQVTCVCPNTKILKKLML